MTWYQVRKIREQVHKEAEENKLIEMIECPNCGYSPLRENSKGYLTCAMCDYVMLN